MSCDDYGKKEPGQACNEQYRSPFCEDEREPCTRQHDVKNHFYDKWQFSI